MRNAEESRDAAVHALQAARRAMATQIDGLPTAQERAALATLLLQQVAGLQRHVAAMRMTAVAELRAQGWSQRRIGQALGLSANAVAQIEDQHRQREQRRPD